MLLLPLMISDFLAISKQSSHCFFRANNLHLLTFSDLAVNVSLTRHKGFTRSSVSMPSSNNKTHVKKTHHSCTDDDLRNQNVSSKHNRMSQCKRMHRFMHCHKIEIEPQRATIKRNSFMSVGRKRTFKLQNVSQKTEKLVLAPSRQHQRLREKDNSAQARITESTGNQPHL